MKRSLICILFLLSFTLTGCWDREEVNDMALIISVGIDKLKDDLIELTIQVFIPNPSATSGSGQPGAGGDGQVSVTQSRGVTVAEAISNLQRKLPRIFFWGHAKAYIFNEAFARAGLGKELDFLMRDVEPRLQANLFICKGSAKDLLLSLNDPNSYETLIKLSQKTTIRTSTILKVEEYMSGESHAFTLPVVSSMVLNVNKMPRNIIITDGTAVLKNKKLIGFGTEKTEHDLQWFQNPNEARNITVTHNEDGNLITYGIIRSSVDLHPTIEDGKNKMRVHLDVLADVQQNASNQPLLGADDKLKKLDAQLNEEIKQSIEKTVHLLQKEMKADVLGFGRAFHKKYPLQWKEMKDNWDETFQNLDVLIEVDSDIRKAGISDINVQSDNEEKEPTKP